MSHSTSGTATLLRFIEASFDRRFWSVVEVRQGASLLEDATLVTARAIIHPGVFAQPLSDELAKLAKHIRIRNANEVIARITRQRLIGPYRWRRS